VGEVGKVGEDFRSAFRENRDFLWTLKFIKQQPYLHFKDFLRGEKTSMDSLKQSEEPLSGR
jgi:hypothetical protein